MIRMGRRLFVPVTMALVLLAACAELRRAPDPGGPLLDEEHEDADADADADDATPTDASTRPDVTVSRPGEDASLPLPCDGPCPPELLADGLSQATAITVDAKNVYFAVEGTSNGVVYQCPKTGCVGAPLALGEGYASSIVVVDGVVYWTDFSGQKVLSCAVGGCNNFPTAIASNQAQLRGPATDGVDLFWASAGDIKRCSLPACSAPSHGVVASGQGSISSLAAGQGRVVWANNAEASSCSPSSCATPTVLGPNARGVSVHAGKAYWVNGVAKTVVSCAVADCNQSPQTIGFSMSPTSPVSDGKHVYWRDDMLDTIVRCPASGCTLDAEVLATQQRGQPGGQLATDGEYVYWTTTTAVRRLRK